MEALASAIGVLVASCSRVGFVATDGEGWHRARASPRHLRAAAAGVIGNWYWYEGAALGRHRRSADTGRAPTAALPSKRSRNKSRVTIEGTAPSTPGAAPPPPPPPLPPQLATLFDGDNGDVLRSLGLPERR